MELYRVTKREMGPGWKEVIGERKMYDAIVADYGMGDAQVVLMTFKGEPTVDENGKSTWTPTYEVGTGECMRPYLQHYVGNDLEEATCAFFQEIVLVGLPTRANVGQVLITVDYKCDAEQSTTSNGRRVLEVRVNGRPTKDWTIKANTKDGSSRLGVRIGSF